MTTSVVRTQQQLDEVFTAYSRFDEFAFDTETHPPHEWLAEHPVSRWGKEDRAEAKRLSLNPRRNVVFWISLAGPGRADVIPLGHPVGEIRTPAGHVKRQIITPSRLGEWKKNGLPFYKTVERAVPPTFFPPPRQLEVQQVFDKLGPLFTGDQIKVGHNVKFDLATIEKYVGPTTLPVADTLVMAHLLDESRQLALDKICEEWLQYSYPQEGKTLLQTSFSSAAAYAWRDAKLTWLWYDHHVDQLKDLDLDGLFRMEMRLLMAIKDMEEEGVVIDRAELDELGNELNRRIEDVTTALYQDWVDDDHPHGRHWNVRSPQDKIDFIYDICGHKVTERTGKTNQPSTSARVIKAFSRDPRIGRLLEYQSLTKTYGTYVEGMSVHIDIDGKLHANFRQAGTETGRLSCSDPNLQNIPRSGEPLQDHREDHHDLGGLIRSVFVAPPGHQLVVADYDQIELRVLAYYSGDPNMLKTFQEGGDPHAATAALVFGVDEGEVTKEQRNVGKTLNFAIVYGAGPATVAQSAGVSTKRAKELLEAQQREFRAVTRFSRRVVKTATRQNPPHVRTILGRIRRLPDLRSGEFKLRSRAERQAVNTVIQGSAADIIKLAMIRLNEELQGTPSRLVLSVHDELAVVTPDDLVEETKETMQRVMEGIDLLDDPYVPLTAEAGAGRSWSEAK